MRYQTFEQAQLQLDQIVLTPFQRAQGQRLINERKEQMKRQGAEAIAARRKELRDRSAAFREKLEGATSAYEQVIDAIEDGDMALEEAQRALADATKRQRELNTPADTHLRTLAEWREPDDPTAYAIREHSRLVQQFPALHIAGRHVNDPLHFPW